MSEMPSEPTPTEAERRPDSILMGPGAAAAVAPTSPVRNRPFVVTLLAIGAGILAVLAVVHLLQALGILPYVIGRLQIRSFNFFYALMWALVVWVYIWLIQMLWRVEPQAWLFLMIVSIFNLILDFVVILGEASWSDVSVSLLLNGLILLYCVLPGTRRAFGTEDFRVQSERAHSATAPAGSSGIEPPPANTAPPPAGTTPAAAGTTPAAAGTTPPPAGPTPPAAGTAPPPAGPTAPPAGTAPAAGGADLMAQLQQLQKMKEAGALTDEEFAAAKAKLLG
jgi:hypothetical protein